MKTKDREELTKARRELKALANEALFVWGILDEEIKKWSHPEPIENSELIAARLAAGIMAGRSAGKPESKDAD
ncbi:putative serine/threonine protein kinase [Paraburkholderia atlantica]|uniref:Serine/threonine protein kinase n=1 Tax=Paraburkholderia atlantica TaxID=2654982 RepID=D5WMD3_PARAM|nr:putative serine/threonine protein kinase [Paraburkholderia atlantica]